jgi:hypothetical protein
MSAAEKARFFSIGHFFLYSPKAHGPRESFVEAKSIGYFRFAVKKGVSLSNGISSTGHKGQVTGAWNDDQFFGLTGQLVSLFAELRGMGSEGKSSQCP